MRRRLLLLAAAWLSSWPFLSWAASGQDSPAPDVLIGTVQFSDKELARILTLSPLPDPPSDPTNAVEDDPRAARLGQWIFFDPRFSGNGEVSCSTCHLPSRSWTDGRTVAEATGVLERHTMSLWNVAYNRWFFWDGRADTLWSQALGPLEDPREHAGSRLQYAHLLAADAQLERAYEDVFGALPELGDEQRFPAAGRPVLDNEQDPLHVAWESMRPADQEQVTRIFTNLGKALAAYQRQILSRSAPFDLFVEGLREGNGRKQRMITDSARRGLKLFLDKARCSICHTGPNFTDMEFHNNRVPPLEDEFSADQGRYRGIELVMQSPFNGAGRYSDDPDGEGAVKVSYLRRTGHNYQEFKTPSLRNVAATAPYMHQGQFARLEDVLHYYSTLENAMPTHHSAEKILQPVGLSQVEMSDLISFLESLTDTSLPAELLSPPPTPHVE